MTIWQLRQAGKTYDAGEARNAQAGTRTDPELPRSSRCTGGKKTADLLDGIDYLVARDTIAVAGSRVSTVPGLLACNSGGGASADELGLHTTLGSRTLEIAVVDIEELDAGITAI